MTHIRNNEYLHNKDVDGVPTQKLQWVTPKISLMEAEDTEGSGKTKVANEKFRYVFYGPS